MIYHFGRFDLDPGLGRLRRDRRPATIEPKALALLCHLVRHRDRVVSKKELLDTVWGGEFGTEAALTTGLRAVRLAIGDTGRQQRLIRTVYRHGYQFVAPTTTVPAGSAMTPALRTIDAPGRSRDLIRFSRTADGKHVAWAAAGTGPPLVKTANWPSALDLERAMPMFAHWFEGLTRGRQLIRYDPRGCGLSDAAFGSTLDEWIKDLDAVADAAGLDRFPLLGVAQGSPLAIAYAARRPERVSRLILNAAITRGRAARASTATERDEAELDLRLGVTGWRTQNLSYLRYAAAQLRADDPAEKWDEFAEYERLTVSTANAARYMQWFSRVDVLDLARHVSCPTLIVNSRSDPRAPLAEATELARLIPDSRMVVLDGRNHLLTADEPAWPLFLTELDAFLAQDVPAAAEF
ncbi:alpha/beta fold hydrolase [Mangrovihabitans endophyticus]|nr:alpha/beta fold hydrolase [Mangrovihabitans endophyticus]